MLMITGYNDLNHLSLSSERDSKTVDSLTEGTVLVVFSQVTSGLVHIGDERYRMPPTCQLDILPDWTCHSHYSRYV